MTSSLVAGSRVPIPTSPVDLIRIRSVGVELAALVAMIKSCELLDACASANNATPLATASTPDKRIP